MGIDSHCWLCWCLNKNSGQLQMGTSAYQFFLYLYDCKEESNDYDYRIWRYIVTDSNKTYLRDKNASKWYNYVCISIGIKIVYIRFNLKKVISTPVCQTYSNYYDLTWQRLQRTFCRIDILSMNYDYIKYLKPIHKNTHFNSYLMLIANIIFSYTLIYIQYRSDHHFCRN